MASNDNHDQSPNDTVEVLETPGTGRWSPAVRDETLALMASFTKLDDQGRSQLTQAAASILSQCVPPEVVTESTTGLVVGYVQSGKTMSYTTVAALARDNGYRMVIVITGTSVPLFGQSSGRLKRDLRLADRPDRKWQWFENPRPQGGDVRSIEDTLADWNDLMERVDRIVANTLGVSLRRAFAERFDRELATDSLRYYAGESIPRVRTPLPNRVSEVNFRADLSATPTLDPKNLRAGSGLFAGL